MSSLRFAPHLERCINGGKRQKRKVDSASESFRNGTSDAFSIRKLPATIIVRIKTKDGGILILFNVKQRTL